MALFSRGLTKPVLLWLLLVLLPLFSLAARGAAGEGATDEAPLSADEEHEKLFLESRFPAATTCATCHPDHYREWSVSPHAYAQMSPVFNAMHGTILKLTNGTNGDFCIRCHTPVGMNLGEPEFMSNMDRHPTSREGVTCVVCHRVNRAYGKLSGRLAIVEGDLFEPVYGPRGNEELERVIESDEYRVNTERGRAGRAIHTRAEKFFQLSEPGFCGTCHDVNLVNGFRLEEAFSEFKTSPAAREKISCQDCHMATEPGVASSYAEAPAALVGGKPTKPRKRTDHMFIGPDYSVLHPGIFPHNTRAAELATIREWLAFDWRAGWGTNEFEDSRPEDYEFPERWSSIDDRYDARDLIVENLQLLEEAHAQRKKVLQAGYRFGEVRASADPRRGIDLRVEVENATTGHGVPTGFDAERLVFVRVTVSDRHGTVVYRSGDLDPNGDVRDTHSLYVHAGELPLDRDLLSLQSRFVTRMVRGGEREQVLAVNYSPDPLPFLRPSTSSTVLTGRPRGARKHKQNIAPGDHRVGRYRVPARELTGEGPYRAKVELVAGMIPVNLIYEIKDVGFDYFMSAREVAERVVEGHLVLWEEELEIDVDAPRPARLAAMGLHDERHDEQVERHEQVKRRHGKGHSSRLTDAAIPLQLEGFPERPKPILELGEPFLGTGTLDPGIELPTGAVWQPSLLAFGTLRSAVQTFEDDAAGRITEWANRLDLFFNLQLSGSERLVLGLRTFDDDGRFSSFFFEHPDPALDGDFRDEFDAEIETLFFEGDFGEIFPNLDRQDFGRTDFGFSLGRQPLLFQEGLLINDGLDGLGVTRNTLLPKGTSNFRATFFYGWDDVHAGQLERDAQLFAVLTSTDLPATTLDVDLAYVAADDLSGDLLSTGVSAVQRFGKLNSSLFLLGSFAVDEETPFATDGLLLMSELSWTPRHNHDHVYLTTFWALDEYTAAARGPAVGGPLGRAGVNFAAVGLGSFTAPLPSRARDAFGGAFGYQMFFEHTRRQLLVEGAFRLGTEAAVDDAFAATVRYQAAFGRRFVLVADAFVSHFSEADRTPWGGRLEWVVKF